MKNLSSIWPVAQVLKFKCKLKNEKAIKFLIPVSKNLSSSRAQFSGYDLKNEKPLKFSNYSGHECRMFALYRMYSGAVTY
ncbi:hypothetical protein A54_61 [Septuagintavirus sv54]|uniref:Uncharacterized protein n=1 Tax=Escherichia phage A5-4 TaxID=2996162 RepID=A0AAE9TJA2_9CAUD|nr:hypothetical protein A54_61 [Escherichia phage A5-4]